MSRAELLQRLHAMAADFRAAEREARAEDELREADWYAIDVATIEAAIHEIVRQRP